MNDPMHWLILEAVYVVGFSTSKDTIWKIMYATLMLLSAYKYVVLS